MTKRLMRDALYMPIFEDGKVWIRMRRLQGLMLQAGYDPLAATFGKS
jgi:hypothetical protein